MDTENTTMSTGRDDESMLLSDPYALLRSYRTESKTLSMALANSQVYYRTMWRCLVYPVVVLSTVATILTVFKFTFACIAINGLIVVLSGFDRIIEPLEKSHRAAIYKVEYQEITSNIKQFIMSNHRTRPEIKQYSTVIHELMNKWSSLRPYVSRKHLNSARRYYAKRVRKHEFIPTE
jgi:hypothetical protein